MIQINFLSLNKNKFFVIYNNTWFYRGKCFFICKRYDGREYIALERYIFFHRGSKISTLIHKDNAVLPYDSGFFKESIIFELNINDLYGFISDNL